MGGRGRGRGRGGSSMSVNIEALGFGRGEALPSASLHPPPTFPVLEHHPLPLEHNEKCNYLIDLKRYFQTSMEDSPYYVKSTETRKDIKRYTDKYKVSNLAAAETNMILYSRVPEELRPQKKKKKTSKKAKSSSDSTRNTIEELEKRENNEVKAESGEEEGSDDEKSAEDDDKLGDEEFDEEDLEEENDYCQEYFDNGEGFGDAEDDALDDGPVY
ncbi:DNA-directed RNA polymerase III subunit RPC7-like [Watersipora subatra]|uniref:DNA-directed RNA polymerase III subunit RPC7-like n=1 Tax=Watersipora subatra TaxID=2589382 RepID=UPI00355B1A82